MVYYSHVGSFFLLTASFFVDRIDTKGVCAMNGETRQERQETYEGYHRGRNEQDKMEMLELRINLFIIKYLYNHLENDGRFYSNGKRRSRIPFKIVLGGGDDSIFNGKWLSNVWSGENFTMSEKKRKVLSTMFALDESYFRSKETKVIEIEKEIDLNHWQSYFWKLQDKDDSGLNMVQKQQAIKVEERLESITKHQLSDFSEDDPVYRIRYYFRYGTGYDLNAAGRAKVKRCTQLIEEIELKEIDGLGLSELSEFEKALADIYGYVKATKLIKTKKLKKS